MSDRIDEAIRQHYIPGKVSYRQIAKILGVSPKTVESRIRRNKDKYQPMQNNTEIDIQSSILKEISKECAISYLCDKYKLSQRMLQATLQDLEDAGYLISYIGDNVKLLTSVIPNENNYNEEWQGSSIIRYGVVSDTHMCNRWQQLTFMNYLYDIFEYEGITTVHHTGDISDGFYKNRPGHIYELMPGMAGADAQADYIINQYPYRKGITTKFITGNHDHTHVMNGGTDIGKMIARDRSDMVYLGQSNAAINITPNCKVELNHPGDGASYAISYSIQKYIDSMSGGEKPNILLNGHHHKEFKTFYRNIHAVEVPCGEAQTPFMKSKRIAAMIGGLINEVHVDKEGTITRFKHELIPLYVPKENDF